jgi:hypothetical protein
MSELWLGGIQVGAVKAIEIPEDYLKTSDKGNQDANYRQSFRSILGGMIHAAVPVGFRLERINEKTRA